MIDWFALLAIVVGGIVVLCLPLIVWIVWKRSPWQRVLGALLGGSVGAVLGGVLLTALALCLPGAAHAGLSLVGMTMLIGGTAGGALGAYLGTWAAGAIARLRARAEGAPAALAEGPEAARLATLFGVVTWLLAGVFLGVLPSLGAAHRALASLLLAGTLCGVVAACVAPRRRWYVAAPLVLVLQALGLLHYLQVARQPGAPDVSLPAMAGAAAGALLGLSAAALCSPAAVSRRRAYIVAGSGLVLLVSSLIVANPTSLLYWTVRRGSRPAVKLLLALGANPNAVGPYRYCPLHLAAETGNERMVALLLSRGAKINVQQHTGETPLYAAAEAGHLRVVKLLIARRAHVNVQESYLGGETPLHAAVKNRHIEVVRALLEAGARTDIKKDKVDGSGWTPLHVAARDGVADAAQALLQYHADPNARDVQARTPLFVASAPGAGTRDGRVKVVAMLLASGAQVDVPNNEGMTALGCASRSGLAEIVKLLLAADASPNVADNKFGLTPLHLAAINGQRDIAEMLIARGANLSARDRSGHTPLSWAIEKNQPALVELLKHHGARP